MRSTPACCAALLFCGTLAAAPANLETKAGGAAAKEQLRTEAEAYAQQLLTVAAHMSERYVRPVPQAELLFAGLSGLYETVRLPVPPSLQAEVQRTVAPKDLQQLITRARLHVGESDLLKGPDALLASCRAMTKSLDPYSGVVEAVEFNNTLTLGECYGVGVELVENIGVGPLLVKTVVPGSPAQKAGLRPGDEITQVGGQTVRKQTSLETLRLLDGITRGPDGIVLASEMGTSVAVTARRAGSGETLTIQLPREEFQAETVLGVSRRVDNSWDCMLDPARKIAQVRIASLGKTTPEELIQALNSLRADGMRGLILDLRWCPGGYLTESVDVARLFLPRCVVATLKSRNEDTNPFNNRDDGRFLDVPVVVLINGQTSGGAELIAAALQDHHRAAIAGQRSLGKASVQKTELRVPGTNADLKLTTGTFLRPNGQNLHRFPDSKPGDEWGVRPDPKLEFRVSPDLSRRLKDWWLQQTLRPGSSNELLPLDNPANDPQRQSALQGLLGLLAKPEVSQSP